MATDKYGVELEVDGADEFIRETERAGKSVQDMGLHFDEASGRWRNASGQFASDAEKAAAGIEGAGKRAEGGANVMQAALTGAFTAIANVAVEAFGRAAQAIGDFVGGSIEAAGDFEQQLSILRVTSGATAEQMKEVSDLSIRLGNDLTLPTTSAQDANDAILELVKGGLSLEQAMDAARGALLLSTAAEIETGEAAAITAGILNAFNLEGEEAARVVDLLAGAAAKGAGEITDYAQGFQQAGFAFNAAKLPAEDLATSLQTLIESGLTGSDAGTALKNAMMRLMNPTKEASKLMAGLGINVYDATGQMKPFDEIIAVVNGGLAGMTDEQRNAALGTIFLSDGMKAMIPLLDEGSDKFKERRDAVSESGAAEALAAAQTEGFKGAQAALQSQLETLQLVIGQRLLPVLTDLFRNHISPAIATVMQMVDAFFAAGGGADQLGAALAPVIVVVESVVAAFQNAGVESSGAFTVIQTVVASVAGYVQAALGVLATFIENNGDQIRGFIQTVWTRIESIVGKAVELLAAIITKVFNFVAEFIEKHGDQIQKTIESVWTVIKTIVETALSIIESVIKIGLAIVQGDWDTVWTEMEKLLSTILTSFVKIVEDGMNALAEIIKTILLLIGAIFKDAWELIKKNAEEQWGQVTAAIQGKLNDIRSAAERIVKDIIGFFDTLPAKLGAAASNAMQSLIDGFNTRLGDIRNAIQSILDSIANIDLNPFDNTHGGKFLLPPSATAPPTTDQVYGKVRGDPGGNNNFSRNYNLSLNTSQSSAGVISDFAIMEALAG